MIKDLKDSIKMNLKIRFTYQNDNEKEIERIIRPYIYGMKSKKRKRERLFGYQEWTSDSSKPTNVHRWFDAKKIKHLEVESELFEPETKTKSDYEKIEESWDEIWAIAYKVVNDD